MKIVSFGQQVMLDKEMTVINQLTVELPSGERVSVPASEETVKALMNLHVGVPIDRVIIPPPIPERVDMEVDLAAQQYLADMDAESEAQSWVDDRDDGDPGEAVSPVVNAVMGTLGEVPVGIQEDIPQAIGQVRAASRARVDADGFAVIPRAKTVPTTTMGYPIVPKGQQVVEQRTLVNDDDDGEQI